jgi:uncharacterized membrane protein YbhN (UPF0104 family)
LLPRAVELVVEHAAKLDPWWLVLGLALHTLSQVVRIRGWFNILRAAYPDAHELRSRDVVAAYFAGGGLNAIVPARGGDLVKLYFVRRRVEGARYSTLAATLLPETLPETFFGIVLVVWALVRGFLPVPVSGNELPTLDISLLIRHPIVSLVVVAALVLGTSVIVRWLRRRGPGLLERLRQGFAILNRPREFLTGVVFWQALGRLIRLAALACFMTAFALPVTLATVVLVMAAQGGGRIIPIAPASAGLRLAMLTYGFVEVTGSHVDIASITAFTVGVGFTLGALGIAISIALIGHTFGTFSPRRAVAAARAAFATRTPAPSPSE